MQDVTCRFELLPAGVVPLPGVLRHTNVSHLLKCRSFL